MVMTRSTAVGSIVTGSMMLGFALIAVICGAISGSKLSGRAASHAGLWSLYLGVPGILSIVAGATKNGIVMAFALFFNILAVIVTSIASVVVLLLTIVFNEFQKVDCHLTDDNKCSCYKGEESGTFDMKCDDLETVHSVLVALLIVFIILTIVTFTASIFGCMGTCCAPHDPVVVVTANAPAQSQNTIVVTSNQSSAQQGYFGQPMVQPVSPQSPPYGYGAQPPMYNEKGGFENPMSS